MALFARRERKSLGWRARQVLWPDTGHGRAARYLLHRVKRLPASPHAIGAGFASGAAVSFLPLIGLHFLLGFALAWLVRGNMVAAALGTAVGNPLTFPIFFSAAYRLGALILDVANGAGPSQAMDLAAEEAALIVEGFDRGMFARLWPVLKVTFVGAIPIAVVAFAAIYLAVRGLAAKFQAARAALKARRRAARLPEGPSRDT